MSTQAAIDATAPAIPPIRIGSFTLRSRLVVGTGKYRDYPTMQAAIDWAAALSPAERSGFLGGNCASFYRL